MEIFANKADVLSRTSDPMDRMMRMADYVEHMNVYKENEAEIILPPAFIRRSHSADYAL